jgi:hypothetical protein
MARGIVLGVVATLVVAGLGAYLGVEAGLLPANADGKPSRLERWAARTSLRATLGREAPKGPNPLPLDNANLIAGIKLYAANCAAATVRPTASLQILRWASIRSRRNWSKTESKTIPRA